MGGLPSDPVRKKNNTASGSKEPGGGGAPYRLSNAESRNQKGGGRGRDCARKGGLQGKRGRKTVLAGYLWGV